MKRRTVNDIKTEIIEIVMAFYYCTNIRINLELIIGQLSDIIEIVSFVLEGYLSEFNDILKRKTGNTFTEERIRTEKQLMISWISMEVLSELRITEITY